MPTVPMQSVRLGGGALGFAFPKNRFILASGEETQTLEKYQKRKRSRSGFNFRPPHAQAQSTRWSFPILFPGFQLLLPEKERGALGEVERLLEVGLMRKDRAVPWRSGWGLDAAGRIGRGLKQGSVPRAWRIDGAELVSSGAGLQGCAPGCLRCAVNKRGPGG